MKTAKVGETYKFTHPNEPHFDCTLRVARVLGDGPEDLVFWADGTHTKQKHIADLEQVKSKIRVELVSAPRPDSSEEDVAYVIGIRNGLSEGRQRRFDDGDFVECDSCSKKPGSPTLCYGCLANRHVIGLLRQAMKEKS